MSISLKQLLVVTTWLTLTLGNYHDIGCTSAGYNETKTLNSSNSIIVNIKHVFLDRDTIRITNTSEDITLLENEQKEMEFWPPNSTDVSEYNPRSLYLWYDGESVKAFMSKIVKTVFCKVQLKNKRELDSVCKCEDEECCEGCNCDIYGYRCTCVQSDCLDVTLSFDSGNTSSNLTFSWYQPDNVLQGRYQLKTFNYSIGYDVIEITLIPHQVYDNIPTSASPDAECYGKQFPELSNTASNRYVLINVTQIVYEQEKGIRLERAETLVNLTEGKSEIIQMKYIFQPMFDYIETRNLTMLYNGNYVYVGMAHLLDNRWSVYATSVKPIDLIRNEQGVYEVKCPHSHSQCFTAQVATNYYTSNWTCFERNLTLDIIAMDTSNDASSGVKSQGIEFYTYINSNSKERNVEYLNFTLYSGCAGLQVFESMLLTIFLWINFLHF